MSVARLGSLLLGASLLAGCVSPRQLPTTSGGATSIDGYRRVVSGDRTMYCRPDQLLGSKIRRPDVCYDESTLKANADAAQEFLRAARGAVGEQTPGPQPGAR